MAKLYRKNSAGKIIKLPSGKLMTDENCCCDEPCDHEIIAAWHYYQTQLSPCILQFVDDSFSDEPIVSWSWQYTSAGSFAWVEFSTSQSPIAEIGVDIDVLVEQVRLVVTDDEGCTDTVEQPVSCLGTSCCAFGLPGHGRIVWPDLPWNNAPYGTGTFAGGDVAIDHTIHGSDGDLYSAVFTRTYVNSANFFWHVQWCETGGTISTSGIVATLYLGNTQGMQGSGDARGVWQWGETFSTGGGVPTPGPGNLSGRDCRFENRILTHSAVGIWEMPVPDIEVVVV